MANKKLAPVRLDREEFNEALAVGMRKSAEREIRRQTGVFVNLRGVDFNVRDVDASFTIEGLPIDWV